MNKVAKMGDRKRATIRAAVVAAYKDLCGVGLLLLLLTSGEHRGGGVLPSKG